MNPISGIVKALFGLEQRQTLRITGTDKNGASVSITDANVMERGFSIDRYSCNGEKLEIGTAIAAELTLKLDNRQGQFAGIVFEGTELLVEIGIADWNLPNPTLTYMPCGYFTPDVQPRSMSFITLNALDRMTRFDVEVDVAALTFPVTVMGLVSAACTECGVTLVTDLSTFPNATYSIAALPSVNGIITYRNLIQWCAGIMGTNAWMDWNGQLQFSWYTTTSSYTALPSNRFSSDLHEDAITITGVQYTNSQGVTLVAGTADYALDLTGNYLAASGISEILSNLNTALNGFSYTPFTASVINAPYLWPMDGVTYRDKDGNDHACILTNVNLCINGATMLAGKGETSETNKGVKPSGMTTEQAQLVTQAMAQVETDIDESLTQEDIFNRLTDNGDIQGMFMQDGQIFFNASYIQSGTLVLGGLNNQNGTMQLLDANGNTVAVFNNAGIDITDGTIVAYTSDRLGRVMLSNGELSFQHYGQDSGTGQDMWLDTLSLSMDSVYSMSQLSSDELPLFISARNKTITLRNNYAPSTTGCQIIMGTNGVLTLKAVGNNGLTVTVSDTVDVTFGGTSLFSIDNTGAVTASQFWGSLQGNAWNITGIAAIANGGTGADTAPDALDNLGIKYTTVTGTTNANGNVSLGLDSRRYSVISVKSTATNYIALPYANTSGAYLWQAHVRDNYAAHSVVANTAVTLLVTYIDFGSNVLT